MDQLKLTLANKLTVLYVQFTSDLQKMRSHIKMDMSGFQDSFQLVEFNWKLNTKWFTMDLGMQSDETVKTLYHTSHLKANQWMASLKTNMMTLTNKDICETFTQLDDCIQKITSLKSGTYMMILNYKTDSTKSMNAMVVAPKASVISSPNPTTKPKSKPILVDSGKRFDIFLYYYCMYE